LPKLSVKAQGRQAQREQKVVESWF